MNAPILLDYQPQGVVLSASQIGRYDDCKRWWAWEYIAKIKGAPHPSAELGSRVHKHLEAWLRDATAPVPSDRSEFELKAVAIAERMITTLIGNGILPGSGAVERRFWLQTRHGHLYTGFIDWSGLLDLPTITDHKTSGDLDWAKTEADLHNDIQAVLYAVAGFVGFGTDSIQLLWNYGQTKGRLPTKAVKTVVHLPVIADKFERVVEPVAAEIIALRHQAPHPLSFPPSPESCGKYGGCPHRQRCNLSDQEIFGGMMNGQQPTMADRMAQQVAGQAAGQAAGQMPPPQGQPPMGQPPQQPIPPMQPPQMAAPPGPPPYFAGPPQGASPMPMAPPGGGQPPQQPYAPTVGPNPPEQSTQMPQQPAAAPEAPKAGPGRPKGSGKKTLTIEQQVFLGGVTAGISNPNFNGQVELLVQAGDAALDAFKKKFG